LAAEKPNILVVSSCCGKPFSGIREHHCMIQLLHQTQHANPQRQFSRS
jgi:hypothetical protein